VAAVEALGGQLHGRQRRDHVGQRAPVDPLHREPGHAVALAGFEQGHDARMAQRLHGLRLAAEALARGLALEQPAGQGLQRDDAAVARVAREVHDAHAAAAQRAQQHVGAYASAPDEAGLLERGKTPPQLGRQLGVLRAQLVDARGPALLEAPDALGDQPRERRELVGLGGGPLIAPAAAAGIDCAAMPEGPDARERASIDALLTEHLSELRAFVGERADRLVLSKESRSDLVQSVCREVVEHAARYRHREGDAFVPLAAAHGRAQDHRPLPLLHGRQARRAARGGAAARPAGATSRATAGRVRARTRWRPSRPSGCRRALDALPAHYRDVIRLARLEGLPLAEVAARTGRSEDAVRNLLFRALGALSDTLTGPPPR
jgi:DNA-directed RNA polymerase specialized sigma24 family protein